MKTKTTAWGAASDINRNIGVPKGSLGRLVKSKRLWQGWLIQRRPVPRLKRTWHNQMWQYRGVLLGQWDEETATTFVEVPVSWFGSLSKIRNGTALLNAVRELEDDLETLRSGENVARMLETERSDALAMVTQGVRGLWAEPDAQDLPVTDTHELLQVFDNVELLPLFEENSAKGPAPVRTPAKLGAGLGRALIVGGDTRPHVERRVSEKLGIAEVEWWEAREKTNLGTHSGKLEQVANGQYGIVYVLLRFCRHYQHWAFRDACRESGTPLAILDRGYGLAQFEKATRYALGLESYVHG